MKLYEGKNILKDVEKYINEYYLIDTHELGNKYETTIYPCDKDGNITSGEEVYVEQFDTENEAMSKHYEILRTFNEFMHEITGKTEYIDSYNDEEDIDDIDNEEQKNNEFRPGKFVREIDRNEESIPIDGMDQKIHVCELFWEDSNGARILTVHGGNYNSETSFSLVSQNGNTKSDEELFDFFKSQVYTILNDNIDKFIDMGWDKFFEFRRIPDFEEYCMLYEGKLGNAIRTAALGAALGGSVACSGPAETTGSNSVNNIDSTKIETVDTVNTKQDKPNTNVDTAKIIMPSAAAEEETRSPLNNHNEIDEWINYMADSVYSYEDNRVSHFLNCKDLFEKFIEDRFKTSKNLKQELQDEAIKVNSFVGRWNRYVYVPLDVTLEELKKEWQEWVAPYYTERKKKIEQRGQYTDNKLYYEDDYYGKGGAHYNQEIPGKYGETYKKH